MGGKGGPYAGPPLTIVAPVPHTMTEGTNVLISPHVVISRPELVDLGDQAEIDAFTVIATAAPGENAGLREGAHGVGSLLRPASLAAHFASKRKSSDCFMVMVFFWPPTFIPMTSSETKVEVPS